MSFIPPLSSTTAVPAFVVEQQLPPSISKVKKDGQHGSGSAAGSASGGSSSQTQGASGTTKGGDSSSAMAGIVASAMASLNKSFLLGLPSTAALNKVGSVVDQVQQLELEACACPHLQEHLPHALKLDIARAPAHPRGWVVANPIHDLHLASQLDDPFLSSSSARTSSRSMHASGSSAAGSFSASASSSMAQPSMHSSAAGTSHHSSRTESSSQPYSTTSMAMPSSSSSGPDVPVFNRRPPSTLYGEEQQRMLAMMVDGIAEAWCPVTVDSSIIEIPRDFSSDDEDMEARPTKKRKSKPLVPPNRSQTTKPPAFKITPTKTSSAKPKKADDKRATPTTAASTKVKGKADEKTGGSKSTAKPTQVLSSSSPKTSQTGSQPKAKLENDAKKTKGKSTSQSSKQSEKDASPTPMEVESTDAQGKPSKKDESPIKEKSKPDLIPSSEDSKKEQGEDPNAKTAADDDDGEDAKKATSAKEASKDSTDNLRARSKSSDADDTENTEKTRDAKKEEKEKPKGANEAQDNLKADMKVDAKDDVKVSAKENDKKDEKKGVDETAKEDATVNSKEDAKADTEEDSKSDAKADTKEDLKPDITADTKAHAKDANEEAKADDEATTKAGDEADTKADTKKDAKSAETSTSKPDAQPNPKPAMSIPGAKTGNLATDARADTGADTGASTSTSTSAKERTEKESTDKEKKDPKTTTDDSSVVPMETTSTSDVKPTSASATTKAGQSKKSDVVSDKKQANATAISQSKLKVKQKKRLTLQPVGSTPPKVQSLSQTAVPSKDASADVVTSMVGVTKPPIQDALTTPFMPEGRYYELRVEEERIDSIRRAAFSRRIKKKASVKVKRKRDGDQYRAALLAALRPDSQISIPTTEQPKWQAVRDASWSQVERWMQAFRQCVLTNQAEVKHEQRQMQHSSFYLHPNGGGTSPLRMCSICTNRKMTTTTTKSRQGGNGATKHSSKALPLLTGDEIMQCLECSFLACAPRSMSGSSRQHMLTHMLMSGHNFAVTCGPKSKVYCFKCGDFVYHPVFEQERQRLEYEAALPSCTWSEVMVRRSFDAFQFMKTPDQGIVWRGLIASYPQAVPKEHLLASQLIMRRTYLFQGRTAERCLFTRPLAINFCIERARQLLSGDRKRPMICAPVGMFNLGNTCFQTAVLQCLVHSVPLQKFFLDEVGHHHSACFIYRQRAAEEMKFKHDGKIKKKDKAKVTASANVICLACEMDRLMLSYFGSSTGRDIYAVLEDTTRPLLVSAIKDAREPIVEKSVLQGEPLITSDLLTAAWKSGGMDHLAGYEQHDAQEFLHSFLDLLCKHMKSHQKRVHASINSLVPSKDYQQKVKERQQQDQTKSSASGATKRAGDGDGSADIVKRLFEGMLRSVLVCNECGGKRVMLEPFLNISLTLSEEVERLEAENRGKHDPDAVSISIESCLDHFILPEKLGDSVFCPTCKAKTATQKQHTVSKLPQILCLQLKRFDASRNRKINNYVSFPAKGLNMGPLLSHWCEVSSSIAAPSTTDPPDGSAANARVAYRLYGTVNHIGTMQSGHYVSNVKVDDQWYHCNDAIVTRSQETDVLDSEGAYLLFYIRE